LIVRNTHRDRIEDLIALLSREKAETTPKDTVTLSVLSGSSLLAVARPETTANVVQSVVRLFT
jgi:hypothetical protein